MQEKNLVRMSMFLIIVAFIFVYSVFLDKNKNIFSNNTTKWSAITVSDISSWDDTNVIDLTDQSATTDPSKIDPIEQELLYQLQWADDKSSSWVNILTWTKLVYDELPSVTKFGLNPKYILKWKWSIYFTNLGKWDIEFDLAASQFAWNTKYIIDMNNIREIIWLNFDNIRFINLPTRKNKLIVFVTKVWWDNWLVQSNPEDYYAYKKYISDTINSWY